MELTSVAYFCACYYLIRVSILLYIVYFTFIRKNVEVNSKNNKVQDIKLNKKQVAPKHVTKYTALYIIVVIFLVSPPTTVLKCEIDNSFFVVF